MSVSFFEYLVSGNTYLESQHFPTKGEHYWDPTFLSAIGKEVSFAKYEKNQTDNKKEPCKPTQILATKAKRVYQFQGSLRVEFSSPDYYKKLWNNLYNKTRIGAICGIAIGIGTSARAFVKFRQPQQNRVLAIVYLIGTIVSGFFAWGCYYRGKEATELSRRIPVGDNLPLASIAEHRRDFYLSSFNDWKLACSKTPFKALCVTEWEEAYSYCDWVRVWLERELVQDKSSKSSESILRNVFLNTNPLGEDFVSNFIGKEEDSIATQELRQLQKYLRAVFALDSVDLFKKEAMDELNANHKENTELIDAVENYFKNLNLQQISRFMDGGKIRWICSNISNYLSGEIKKFPEVNDDQKEILKKDIANGLGKAIEGKRTIQTVE